ncbi:hypothetical protein MK489_02110 [Myxococcota bacterium]|nr:hypothetical protein [Myxococcota bacterium]
MIIDRRSKKRGVLKRAAAVLAAGVMLFVVTAAPPLGGVAVQTAEAKEYGAEAVATSVLLSAFYLPAKCFYAAFGAATAGLAYGFTLGNEEISNKIWTSAVEGSYIITPAMAQGDEKVRFQGP